MTMTQQPLTGANCSIFTFDDVEPIELYTVSDIHFDSVPLEKGKEGAYYVYAIYASDSISCNNITVTADSELPDWLQFTETGQGTAVLQGVPTVGDAGTYTVELSAADGGGGVITQQFDIVVIEVDEVNDDPGENDLGVSTFLMFTEGV